MKLSYRHLLLCLIVIVGLLLTASLALAHGDEPEGEGETPTVELDPDFAPTYYSDIEPIFAQNCMGCHLEGQIGYSVYPMDDLELTLAGAQDIAYLTQIGYMPPWPPSEKSLAMHHERGLTAEEIAIIQRWADNDAPLGDASERQDVEIATVPTFEPDVVLSMAEAYTPDASLTDDYRCFIIETGFEEDTYVTRSQVLPGAESIVHHVIVYQLPPYNLAEARALDAQDETPGYQCFGGPRVGTGSDSEGMTRQRIERVPPETIKAVWAQSDSRAQARGGGIANSLGAWVPGNMPYETPEGTGILVNKGNFVVLQMHYNLAAGTDADVTQVALQTAPADSGLIALRGKALLGPVEVPCPPDVEGEACSRDYALDNAERIVMPYALLAICDKTADDYADNTHHATTSCVHEIDFDGWLISTLPHMHQLGSAISTTLNADSPDAVTIIDIPNWDFDWQGSYRLLEPVPVKAGDTLTITCSWDNSQTRDNPDPRYVVWGERTVDEMCLNVVRFVPASQGWSPEDLASAD